jgi:hypothetical protein
VLNDPLVLYEDDTDYNIPLFNILKKALMKIERLNPDLDISGTLWQWYPTNKRMASPAVAGKALPKEGWSISPCNPSLYKALTEDANTSYTLENGRGVYYFPVKTSAGDMVGALELVDNGRTEKFEKRRFMSASIN